MNPRFRLAVFALTTAAWTGFSDHGVELPRATEVPTHARMHAPGSSRGARIAERLHRRGWSAELSVAAIAALPIVELRGAIPVGVWYFGMPWYRALLWAWVGNLVPVPLILLLLEPVSKLARRRRWGDRFMEWLMSRARRRIAEVQRYEKIGLAVFVAIPLPATGAWTGAMVAVLLSMPFMDALLWISVGVLVAGVIVTSLTLLGWAGVGIAAVALLAMAASGVRTRMRRPSRRSE